MALDDDFDFEPSKHEPEEWDPEADFRDPNSDSITIPEVSTPASEVPKEVARPFWTIVLVLNVAILFVSLGPMLWYFRGDVEIGLSLIAGGLALFAMAYRRYRRFEQRLLERDEGSNGSTADAEAAETDSTLDPESANPSNDPEQSSLIDDLDPESPAANDDRDDQ